MKPLKFLFPLFLILLLVSTEEVKATHFHGGELTWECTDSGNYRFKLVIYQDCFGIPAPQTLTLWTNASPYDTTGILVSLIGVKDISPVCNSAGPHILCNNSTYINSGGVEMVTYTSDSIFPNGLSLGGVPPATGWYFRYSSCCPNPATNITSAINDSWLIQAVMYPYNNTPMNTCFDNSPQFADVPMVVHNVGVESIYNTTAYDPDLDSLHYSMVAPFVQPITYAAGYSAVAPFPSSGPGNMPLVMDPTNGTGKFKSQLQGAFVTKTKVTAWKCGVKVAEVFRENYHIIGTHPYNEVPTIFSPFQDTAGNYTVDSIEIMAGDSLSFTINAGDTASNFTQNVTMWIYGSVANNPHIQWPATTNLPTLTPTASQTSPAQGPMASTLFTWQTTCDNLPMYSMAGCGSLGKPYKFLVQAQDDFCPIPSYNMKWISVYVKDLPGIAPPDSLSVQYDSVNHISTLNWIPPVDTLGSFKHYYIWYSIGGGPFLILDTVFNLSQNSYTYQHTGSSIGTTVNFYMTSASGCYGTQESDSSIVASVVVTNSIEDPVKSELIKVYPNPAREEINIELDKSYNDFRIEIIDIQGKVVFSETYNFHKVQIDLGGFATGTYVLKVVGSVKILQETFVVK